MNDLRFAVVDVETTGLSRRTDRVVELAIVQMEAGGRIVDEFETLVNPDRDVGARSIHGLSARHLVHAPRFADVAGDALERLAGCVLVGHNLRFDLGFLRTEFERLGCGLPVTPSLCTYRFTQLSLDDCCDTFGIERQQSHAALEDARATAHLLDLLRRTQGFSLEEVVTGSVVDPSEWPRLPKSGRTIHRSQLSDLESHQPHFLARLVTRLQADRKVSEDSLETAEYTQLLHRALEDRLVTEAESEALYAYASEVGLTADQVSRAHVIYLERMSRAAVADGVVTDAEYRDLRDVAQLLGCDEDTLSRSLAKAQEEWKSVEDLARSRQQAPMPVGNDLAGKSVCFTGELIGRVNCEPISRELAWKFAIDAGLQIRDSVTKSLDILVVADPHTQSGKAKKARQYGTRIMAEPALWQAIGVRVD